MADIIPLRPATRAASSDRYAVIYVHGSAGGVEVARAFKEGRAGTIYLIGMCETAGDVDELAEAADTPEGIAILNAIAPAALRAATLAETEAAVSAQGAGASEGDAS